MSFYWKWHSHKIWEAYMTMSAVFPVLLQNWNPNQKRSKISSKKKPASALPSTHFWATVLIYSPWKHQKIFALLGFFKGVQNGNNIDQKWITQTLIMTQNGNIKFWNEEVIERIYERFQWNTRWKLDDQKHCILNLKSITFCIK